MHNSKNATMNSDNTGFPSSETIMSAAGPPPVPPTFALTVVKALPKLYSIWSSFSSERKKAKKYKEILNYLKRLEAGIQDIKKQNNLILKKLDELPDKIRAIVAQEVKAAIELNELNNRYHTLDTIINNYESFGNRVSITSNGFLKLSEALRYIFKYENRVSRLPELLYYCDFTLLVTSNKAMEMVTDLVEDKRDLVYQLIQKIDSEIKATAQSVSTKLHTKFISKSNVSSITSLDELTYSFYPARKETRSIWSGGSLRDGYYYDAPIPENIAYNKKRLKTVGDLKKTVEGLASRINHKNELHVIVNDYDNYIIQTSPSLGPFDRLKDWIKSLTDTDQQHDHFFIISEEE